MHGPWKILSTREVYRDPWMHLVRDEVLRPDGQPGSFAVVHIKAGVSVLALDDEDHVYLTEEFRYAVGRYTLEVVSGGADPGEDPLTAARRELKEELGILADEWLDLGQVDPFTSMLLSPTRLYLARRLHFGEHAPEGTEQIRCLRVPLAEAVAAVMDGRITNGPSCVLILKASRRLQSARIG
jgi:ADP-ribose pyrophosphatase